MIDLTLGRDPLCVVVYLSKERFDSVDEHYNEETDQEEGPCKSPQIPRPMPGRLCESLAARSDCILEATILRGKPRHQHAILDHA